MKFAQHLSAHITPEWRKQYINYEEMKVMLRLARESFPDGDPAFEGKIQQFEDDFFKYCNQELKKINTFFQEKLAEATRKHCSLQGELQYVKGLQAKQGKSRIPLPTFRPPGRKIGELKLAFSEFYLSLVILQNYQDLNFTGFRKILKKHDKMLKTEIGAKWREERVDTAQFYVDKSIDSLLADTETIYTEELESGDRQRAMKRLRVPPLGQVKPQEWTTFKVGLFFGAFIVLFIIVVLAGLWRRETISWNIFFRLYRGPFWIVLFVFFIAGNVSGWRRNGVNHVLIFELDPRSSLTDQHLFELAGLFGVLWCLSVLCFLYADILTVPPYVNPLMLIVIMIAFLFNPSRTFLHGARFWLLRVMGRMCIAPFAFVNFADFWIADQLNSLTRALADLHYLFCFYGTLNGNWYYQEENSKCLQELWWTRLLVLCLPAWFRLAQCLRRYKDSKEAFPHLANGLKYATSFGVVISSTLYGLYPNGYYYKEVDSSSSIRTLAGNLNKTALAQLINERIHSDQRSLSSIDEIEKLDNPFFISWLACLFISSLYAFIWDVKIDWGLFDSKTGENTLLREEIVYGSCWIYYAAIIQDFVIRFCWAISISLSEIDFVQKEVITTVFGTLEVFRRFVWNFFRLENEHLNNCGKFRAVRDISIVPLAISDQEEIIKMMDNDDFSVYYNQSKKSGKKRKDEEGIIKRKPKRYGRAKKQRNEVVRVNFSVDPDDDDEEEA
ncbi:solute carrier family 53 member 1-like [Artemia franciscana]|uniref:Xenotropic and polytropic retrovirus receptor 1 n=1 Tax=Artemia franciscana TaxID=6661 RepID=A0AA88LKQ8_ARTSF|nr:hypothetical protein QYM36_008002 [Artemia franciscana]KAK2727361.1 hypothetical protein QYM36_008002 [Artemia franciscana]